MHADSDGRTRHSLLGRMLHGPNQGPAWQEFVERYWVIVYRFGCRRSLQPDDAQDVAQDVLLRLFRGLRGYDRARGRFRDWLGMVALNAVRDFVAERQRAGQAAGEDVVRLLENVEAREELMQRLGEQFDLELLEQAREEVKIGVEESTWEAYRLLAEEGLPGAVVAQRLGLAVATVYAHRCRVQEKVRAAVRRLENEGVGGERA